MATIDDSSTQGDGNVRLPVVGPENKVLVVPTGHSRLKDWGVMRVLLTCFRAGRWPETVRGGQDAHVDRIPVVVWH